MQERFSTARTAQILDISTKTLKTWYRWWEDESFTKPEGLKLPKYTTDNRGTKFFTMEAVQELAQFKKDLQTKYRGCMATFNAIYNWGQRGSRILEKKAKKRKEEKVDE